jgi:hypothetical protein
MPTEPDYYKLLRVPADADAKAIIASYRRLARRYHPDIATDPRATRLMLALNRAVEVLADPKRRQDYDRGRLMARAREALAREAGGEVPPNVHTEPQSEESWEQELHDELENLALMVVEREVGRPRPAPRSAPKKSRTGLIAALAAGAIALVLIGAVALAAASDDGRNSAQAPAIPSAASDENTVAPRSAVAAESASPEPTISSPFPYGSGVYESRGTWVVATAMTPGVWRAIKAEDGCNWKRLAAQELSDEAVRGAGTAVTVEIRPTDIAFWSEKCGWWTQILTPPSDSPAAPFGQGTWLVGEEVAPGLWQNSDSSATCTWARLATLDGSPTAVASNGTTGVSGLAIQIAPEDVAFHSWGCGTWTRVGD